GPTARREAGRGREEGIPRRGSGIPGESANGLGRSTKQRGWREGVSGGRVTSYMRAFPAVENADAGRQVQTGQQPLSRDPPRLVERRTGAGDDHFAGHIKKKFSSTSFRCYYVKQV